MSATVTATHERPATYDRVSGAPWSCCQSPGFVRLRGVAGRRLRSALPTTFGDVMPEQEPDENTVALSRKFEASKPRYDTTHLPVFVTGRISLLVEADDVLHCEYRSTEDTPNGGTRSGGVVLITSDSVVTANFKDVEDEWQPSRKAAGKITVLVRPWERPNTIELVAAENRPLEFLKAESLKLTFEGWGVLELPLVDRGDAGAAYVRDLMRVLIKKAPRRHL
jgi:hypothetical protein